METYTGTGYRDIKRDFLNFLRGMETVFPEAQRTAMLQAS